MICSRCKEDKAEEFFYLSKTGKRAKTCKSCKSAEYKARYGSLPLEKKQERIRYHREYDHPWCVYKKDICRRCGFTSGYSCQLTVDHIDRDKSNNSESNLQTLCHNCHHLKTHIERTNPLKLKELNLVP